VSVAPGRSTAGPRVVAFGGGHGLAASLAALRRITPSLTAVVTVADDGGSSGRLRTELGALPPGDLRMALAALADEDPGARAWADVLQYRFPGAGPLAGHALGNLMLTGLVAVTGAPVRALDLLGRLVGARGRVLPVATEPLDIVAEVAGLDADDPAALRQVRGQVAVATTPGMVRRVFLVPARPASCPEAVQAVMDADWVVLGPGSWFTSVLPHLLVPELARALLDTEARRLLTLNLVAQPGETRGFTPETHLQVLAAHAPQLTVDVVLADPTAIADGRGRLAAAARELGADLVVRAVAASDGSPRHDPERLADAYAAILGSGRGGGGAPPPPPAAGAEPAAGADPAAGG
jgi:uncharacterized cofD-like protein